LCCTVHDLRTRWSTLLLALFPHWARTDAVLMVDAGLRIKSILNFAFEAEPSLDADFQLESQLSPTSTPQSRRFHHQNISSLWEGDRASERVGVSDSLRVQSIKLSRSLSQVEVAKDIRLDPCMPNGSVSLRPVVRQPRWSSLGVCLVHLCSRRLIVRTRSSLGRLRSCLSENLHKLHKVLYPSSTLLQPHTSKCGASKIDR